MGATEARLLEVSTFDHQRPSGGGWGSTIGRVYVIFLFNVISTVQKPYAAKSTQVYYYIVAEPETLLAAHSHVYRQKQTKPRAMLTIITRASAAVPCIVDIYGQTSSGCAVPRGWVSAGHLGSGATLLLACHGVGFLWSVRSDNIPRGRKKHRTTAQHSGSALFQVLSSSCHLPTQKTNKE